MAEGKGKVVRRLGGSDCVPICFLPDRVASQDSVSADGRKRFASVARRREHALAQVDDRIDHAQLRPDRHRCHPVDHFTRRAQVLLIAPAAH
jgi:hypothetical protein